MIRETFVSEDQRFSKRMLVFSSAMEIILTELYSIVKIHLRGTIVNASLGSSYLVIYQK